MLNGQHQDLPTFKHLFIYSLNFRNWTLLYLTYLTHESLPFTLFPILFKVNDGTTYTVAQAEIKESLQIPSLC